MVMLLLVARTPEPAIASTHCLESFALAEVHDKLEDKFEEGKKPVGAIIQQVHATRRDRRATAQVKMWWGKEKEKMQERKKKVGLKHREKKRGSEQYHYHCSRATTVCRGTEHHTFLHPKNRPTSSQPFGDLMSSRTVSLAAEPCKPS